MTNTMHQAIYDAKSCYKERPLQRLVPRATLRGLRTILYSHVFKANDKEKFYVLDKSSLYPYAALTCNVPFGEPEYLIGPNLKDFLDTDIKRNKALTYKGIEICGFVHCALEPDPKDDDPFIMVRFPEEDQDENSDAYVDQNKKLRNLCVCCYACGLERNQGRCNHKGKEKWILGHFTSIEICYAVLHCNYKLREVYEIVHWPKNSPLLRDFMMVLGRKKLLSSKLPNLSQRQLQTYLKTANKEMGLSGDFKIKLQDFKENKEEREFIKSCLVELLGIFAINAPTRKCHLVYTNEALQDLFLSKKISQIKPISNKCLCVVTDELDMKPHSDEEEPSLKKSLNKPDTFSYFPIYSFIVAQSRILMHQDVTKIKSEGGKMYSLHCDAVYFTFPKSRQHPFTNSMGEIFGFYKDEVKDGEVISFVAKNERTVSMVVRKLDGSIEEKVKVNGLSMGLEFVQKQVSPHDFDEDIIADLEEERKRLAAGKTLTVSENEKKRIVKQPIMVSSVDNPFQKSVSLRKFTVTAGLKSRVPGKDFDTKPYGYK